MGVHETASRQPDLAVVHHKYLSTNLLEIAATLPTFPTVGMKPPNRPPVLLPTIQPQPFTVEFNVCRDNTELFGNSMTSRVLDLRRNVKISLH